MVDHGRRDVSLSSRRPGRIEESAGDSESLTSALLIHSMSFANREGRAELINMSKSVSSSSPLASMMTADVAGSISKGPSPRLAADRQKSDSSLSATLIAFHSR